MVLGDTKFYRFGSGSWVGFKPVSAEMIRGLGFMGDVVVSGRCVVGSVNVSFISY